MNKEEEYKEIILETKKWFENKKSQLQLVVDNKNLKFLVQDEKGNKVDLPENMKEGFSFGIQTALEILGEFPIKITNNKNEENDDNDN